MQQWTIGSGEQVGVGDWVATDGQLFQIVGAEDGAPVLAYPGTDIGTPTPAALVERWLPVLHQRDDLEADRTLCAVLPWSGQPVPGPEPLPCPACIRERQRRRGVGRHAE